MPSVPREKYPEMNWRAADKVAAWKLFKWQMQVILVADQIPEERQWALILVAGGDEAYNHWDTLEETVQDCKKVDQVWDAFEKSFKQSTSFWHFRDTYLADFRQAGFPLGLENLENLEKWEGIFQSGKSQGILNRLEKSGKITQNTGKLGEFEINIILYFYILF